MEGLQEPETDLCVSLQDPVIYPQSVWPLPQASRSPYNTHGLCIFVMRLENLRSNSNETREMLDLREDGVQVLLSNPQLYFP
jgi:hypothetical protein